MSAASRALARLRRDERGIALVIAVALMALIATVSLSLLALVAAENTRSRAGVVHSDANQAAEAGVNAYMADLTEVDGFAYVKLAEGEATRTANGVAYKSSPTANTSWGLAATVPWTYSTPLTAPSSQQPWRPLGNGYEYLLKIYPISSQEVRIVSIGRPTGSTDMSQYRAIETIARSLSVSDFQMLAATKIVYGAGATTTGLVYVGPDDTGDIDNLYHCGTATADLMSEGDIVTSGSECGYKNTFSLVAPAHEYTPDTSPSIRRKIRTPITFSTLRASPLLVAFPSKAQAGASTNPKTGLYLNDSSVDAWWIRFQSNGTVTVQKCTKYTTSSRWGGTTTYPIESRQPTCSGSPTTYTLSTGNVDIFVKQDAIVSGHVKDKATIYSQSDVVVADNIDYVDPGSNVLGLIADDSVYVACWQPEDNLSWRAATLALRGTWQSDTSCGSNHSSMTFTGSTAAYEGGSMGGYDTRTYNYDSTLRYLIPPDYPRIAPNYTIELQRSVAPS